MFYFVDAVLEDARRVEGWRQFHRACGAQGLYFDDIDKVSGKRGFYSAITFRLEERGQGLSKQYLRFLVSSGEGKGPIPAVLSAFDAAVAAGFPVDPAHREILVPTKPAQAFDDLDALIGVAFVTPPAEPDFASMIG